MRRRRKAASQAEESAGVSGENIGMAAGVAAAAAAWRQSKNSGGSGAARNSVLAHRVIARKRGMRVCASSGYRASTAAGASRRGAQNRRVRGSIAGISKQIAAGGVAAHGGAKIWHRRRNKNDRAAENDGISGGEMAASISGGCRWHGMASAAWAKSA